MYREAHLRIAGEDAHDHLVAMLGRNPGAFTSVCDHVNDYFVRDGHTRVIVAWNDRHHDLDSIYAGFSSYFDVLSIEAGRPYVPDGLSVDHTNQLYAAGDVVMRKIEAGTLTEADRVAMEQAQEAAFDQGAAAIEDFMQALAQHFPRQRRA